MEKKIEAPKTRNSAARIDLLFYIIVLIALLVSIYALYNIGTARQEVVDYYEDYMDSHCRCGDIYKTKLPEPGGMADFIKGDQNNPWVYDYNSAFISATNIWDLLDNL